MEDYKKFNPKSTESVAEVSGELSPELKHIPAAADLFGQFLILDCIGFIPNARQRRQSGLACIQVAQRLQRRWRAAALLEARKAMATTGNELAASEASGGEDSSMSSSIGNCLEVPNEASSRPGLKPGGRHPFDWRDLFDCSVHWRQISEPNDTVWWIDRFPPEAFEEGFGLQTPLVNGQLKVYRYYPYFNQAFNLMKDLIVGMMGDGPAVQAVKAMTSLEELYSAWGKGDFWMVSPCHSTALPGRTMEGTRLTVQKKVRPSGFDVRPKRQVFQ